MEEHFLKFNLKHPYRWCSSIEFAMETWHCWSCIDLPKTGTAIEVEGTRSAIVSENTLKESRIVIPETIKERIKPRTDFCSVALNQRQAMHSQEERGHAGKLSVTPKGGTTPSKTKPNRTNWAQCNQSKLSVLKGCSHECSRWSCAEASRTHPRAAQPSKWLVPYQPQWERTHWGTARWWYLQKGRR